MNGYIRGNLHTLANFDRQTAFLTDFRNGIGFNVVIHGIQYSRGNASNLEEIMETSLTMSGDFEIDRPPPFPAISNFKNFLNLNVYSPMPYRATYSNMHVTSFVLVVSKFFWAK